MVKEQIERILILKKKKIISGSFLSSKCLPVSKLTHRHSVGKTKSIFRYDCAIDQETAMPTPADFIIRLITLHDNKKSS